MKRGTIKIGDVGEDLLTLWATQEGINVVEPKRDCKGWDRQFEFPGHDDSSSPTMLDRRPAELVCKIQVKASRNPSCRRVSVKLDNWDRFVRCPIPCFFVVYIFSDAKTPTDTFLIHVNETWMGKVLRRLREEAASVVDAGNAKFQLRRNGGGKKGFRPLREMQIDLSWTEANRLEECSASCLSAAIVSTVGDPLAYSARKLDLIDTLGYETGRTSILFTTPTDDETYERIADFAIGNAEHLRVEGIRINDVRFGIPIPVGGDTPTDGKILSAEPARKIASIITLTSSDGLRSVNVNCDTRTSMSLFPFLPTKFWKVRCSAPYVDFEFCQGTGELKCKFSTGSLDDVVQMRDYEVLASIVGILEYSSGEEIKVAVDIRPGPENVKLRFAGRIGQVEPWIVELGQAVRDACSVAHRFHLEGEHAFTPSAVLDDHRYFVNLADLFAGQASVQVTTSFEVAPPPFRIVFLFPMGVRFGEHLLVAYVSLPEASVKRGPTGALETTFHGTAKVEHYAAIPKMSPEKVRLQIADTITSVADRMEQSEGIDEVIYNSASLY